MTAAQMLALGGYPNTNEGRQAFYKEYPDEATFRKKFGGVPAFPQQPTEETFFSKGHIPNSQRAFYAQGGIAFPQQPEENMFFSGYPFEPSYAKGGMPCYNCGGAKYDVGGGVFGYGYFPTPQYGGMTMADSSQNLDMYGIGGLAQEALNEVMLPTKKQKGGTAPQGATDTTSVVDNYKNRFKMFLDSNADSAINDAVNQEFQQNVAEAQGYADQMLGADPMMGMNPMMTGMANNGGFISNPYAGQLDYMQNQVDQMDQLNKNMMRPMGQQMLGNAVNQYKKWFGKKGVMLPKHQTQGPNNQPPANAPAANSSSTTTAPASNNPFDQNAFNTMMDAYEAEKNKKRQAMLEEYYGQMAQNYGQMSGYPYYGQPSASNFIPRNNPLFNAYYVNKFKYKGPNDSASGKFMSEGFAGADPSIFNREMSPEEKAKMIEEYKNKGLDLNIEQDIKNRWLFPKMGPKRVKTKMQLRTSPGAQTQQGPGAAANTPADTQSNTAANTPMTASSFKDLGNAKITSGPGLSDMQKKLSGTDRFSFGQPSSAGQSNPLGNRTTPFFMQKFLPGRQASSSTPASSVPSSTNALPFNPITGGINLDPMQAAAAQNVLNFATQNPTGIKALGGTYVHYDDGGQTYEIDSRQRLGIDPMQYNVLASGITGAMNQFGPASFSKMNAALAKMDEKRDPMNFNLAQGKVMGYNTFDPYSQILPGDPTRGLTTTPWGSGSSPRDMNTSVYGAKYGGNYAQGGVYDMNDDEIEYFMAMGGTIEYLD